MSKRPHTLPGPVHHYAYVVEDIEAGIEHFVTTLGAGPFYVIEHVPLENPTFRGQPGLYDHTAAFGQCGSMPIELQQVHRCEPDALAERLVFPAPGFHHIAWVVPDVEEASAELESEHGAPRLLSAQIGDIHHIHHDARDRLGHLVELHADVPMLHDFWGMVQDASIDWDGSDPIRTPQF